MLLASALLVLALDGDGLSETQRRKCDGSDGAYAKSHYDICCGKGRYMFRDAICQAAAPVVEDDERTPSYPKLRTDVSAPCLACARLIDNFKMALLPRLAERNAQLQRSRSKSKLAASASIGELEAIVEDEVDRICSWPRTHHQKAVRRACKSLVEERSEELVRAISSWARDGEYGMHLGEAVASEVRPALCGVQGGLGVCDPTEIEELEELDADEAEKIKIANETGHVAGATRAGVARAGKLPHAMHDMTVLVLRTRTRAGATWCHTFWRGFTAGGTLTLSSTLFTHSNNTRATHTSSPPRPLAFSPRAPTRIGARFERKGRRARARGRRGFRQARRRGLGEPGLLTLHVLSGEWGRCNMVHSLLASAAAEAALLLLK